MIHKIEHSDLINMVRIIDVRHEFLKEWENDENMIRMFIDLNIGNFLPGDEDTFGSYLTNLMNFKGLTPTVLAERTGISYNTIYKYLSDYGRSKPQWLSFTKKANAPRRIPRCKMPKIQKCGWFVLHYIWFCAII